MTPNTGPFDVEVVSDAVSALFDKIGPGILVTHSQGGGPGWFTAMKNRNVRAVVSYEPGSGFVFPERRGAASDAERWRHPGGALACPCRNSCSSRRIPIIIFYGDNIPEQPTTNPSAGPVACSPCNGQAVGGRGEPQRR